MRRSLASLPLVLALLTPALAVAADRPAGDPNAPLWQGGYPKVSPFQSVRYPSTNSIEVRVNDTWYRLLALSDLPTPALIAACQSLDKDGWQRRFEQDLVEVLARTNHPLADPTRTTLKVQPVAGGDEQSLTDVPLTKENRRALWHARQSRRDR